VQTRFRAFVLDSDLRQLTREGREIPLTPKAFDLLAVLVAEAGRVVSKAELHQRLWPDTFVSDSTLVSVIKMLRRALSDHDSRTPIIRTAHRVGYAFIAPIDRQAPPRSGVRRWICIENRRIPLRVGHNLIGRDPASAVHLDACDVSLHHARIVVDQGGARVEDLASEQGTRVNNLLVTDPVLLHDDDELHIGFQRIVYHMSGTRPSVAVLPFADMSQHQDQAYLCEGIAEELIHALTTIDGLQVPARSSSFQFTGKAVNIREVGAQLNVDTVLQGSIRTAHNRLRLTAHLVNVSDGYQLWSERYDRTFDDVFALQDEIVRAIVAKLKVTLHMEPEPPLTKRHTDDLEAYTLYLQGRHHLSLPVKGALQRAIGCFEQAIAHDPSYALAHAGLADAFNTLGMFGGLPARVAWSKAKPAAQQAILLNDELAEAHQTRACVDTFFEWDFVAAEREFRRAITLSPRSGLAHSTYGYLLGILGRFEDAIAEATRGRALEPMSPHIGVQLATIFFFARRLDEGLDACRRALEIEPTYALAHWAQILALTAWGRYDEALDIAERALSLSWDFVPAAAAWIYAVTGQREKSDAILSTLRARSPGESRFSLTFAWIAIARGEIDQAFGWLECAYEDRNPTLLQIGVTRVYDPVRGDPRFAALLKRVGLGAVVPAAR
jgi:TolB-like protein/DNA-binding winged helix-turn-helix (wHTH) protein/Flp pilus assembly protein TadD